MYYLSEPPYFLSAIGFLIALASGAAFSGTLKQIVQQWSSDHATNQQIKMQKKVMLLPFLGITLGVVIFLSSGLEIFWLYIYASLCSGCAFESTSWSTSLVTIRQHVVFNRT